MRQREDVVVHDAFQMAAKDLAGIDFIKTVPKTARQKSLSLAGIEERAVSGYRHEHIVGAKIKMLGDLYRGDDIREPRDADIVEGTHHIRVDLAPSDEVAASGIAAEQQIERIAGQIGNADDEVGVHDVVDQRNMLVADTLDFVVSITLQRHGWTCGGCGGDD